MSMFGDPQTDTTLTARVAALEEAAAALAAQQADEAEARATAITALSGERQSGDTAAGEATQAEQEARVLSVQAVDDRIGDEIIARADADTALDERINSLSSVSEELAAEAGAAAGEAAGRIAAIRAVYGTGYRFDMVVRVGTSPVTILTADDTRVRVAIRVRTYGGRAIVNYADRPPSLYDFASQDMGYADGLTELVGADCPLGDITAVSLGGEIEMLVSITNISGYDPATAAMLARFAVQPTDERRMLIQDRYSMRSSAGIIAALDASIMCAAADAQAGLVNWAAPTVGQIVNTVPFAADRGFTGGGGYIRTNILLPAAKYTINDASMFCWISDTLVENNTFTMGWGAGAIQPNRSLSNGGSAWMRPNINGNQVVTTGGIGGFFGWTRDNPDNYTVYWYDPVADDLITHSYSGTAETAFQRELFLLGNNGALGVNSLCHHQIMAADAGAYLSPSQVETMVAADLAYLRAIGAHA